MFMLSLLRTITVISALAFAVTSFAADIKVKLTGAEEVPPVSTAATGAGTIKVNDDMTVSGSVTTKGIDGVAAHIHSGAVGKNGPPVIPLEQTSPGVWSVPAGSKLTADQYKAFKAGELYVNVHSAAHKGGELRGQLKP
jgi:hypothetical protein